jgi:hypothetical protein
MFKVICLIFVASAAVPPFTYRLPSPVYKTYATTNSHGKSPSSLSPKTSTLVSPAESFDETTFESSAGFTKTPASQAYGDDYAQKTEFALKDTIKDTTDLPFESIGLFFELESSPNLATLHPTYTSSNTTTGSTSSQYSKENTDIDFVRINKRKRRRRTSTDPGAESFFTQFSMPPIPAMTSTSDPVTSATQPQITTTAADPAITVAEAVQLASALSIFAGKENKIIKL